jgi:hypothetical protein
MRSHSHPSGVKVLKGRTQPLPPDYLEVPADLGLVHADLPGNFPLGLPAKVKLGDVFAALKKCKFL